MIMTWGAEIDNHGFSGSLRCRIPGLNIAKNGGGYY